MNFQQLNSRSSDLLKQAAILSDGEPKMVFVDRGYRGVEVERAQGWPRGKSAV
ncbi:hypothetical protein JJB74_12965 [Noviherbaspirillum sp. DKR-6]|uniref:Uncharacterized protein n=1 Tax=Noviherbaspirillum pedocola TaxID=2801341 RepID=A0A934SYZ3_9BURK|nr:hypothetical protein [Noviherbaspirillum pedocola]